MRPGITVERTDDYDETDIGFIAYGNIHSEFLCRLRHYIHQYKIAVYDS